MHRIKLSEKNFGRIYLLMKCINFNEFKWSKENLQRKKYEHDAEKFFSNGYYSSDIKEKIKFYTISIKLKPSFIDAYFNRAELYKELEEYNKSIEIIANFRIRS